ncbi:MAG: glycoprotein [Frankiales bacterium]|nr:glycoprotein [Frankiales bacterium]
MRRLVTALLLSALVPLTALGALPAAADPTPAATQAPEAPLQLVVTSLLPRAPQRHDAIEVTGYVKNVGSVKITGIEVRPRVGNVIQTRGGLHNADTDRPYTSPREPSVTPVGTTLAPGAQTSFDLRTTVDLLQLTEQGVYPVDIEARGDAGNGLESLGLAPTWIPFFADVTPNPIRVAVVWPLVDQPHQGVDATLLDDKLAADLGPSGRLGGLLVAGRRAATPECVRGAVGPDGKREKAPVRCEPVPVTYAVDPDLLFAANTMTKPYKVKTNRGSVAGTGTTAATDWLASLRDVAATSPVLALPYADPDVTALTRTAAGVTDVALASVLGRSTVSRVLQSTTLDSVAWPPAGPVTQAASDALAGSGARAFVLDPSAYPLPDTEPNPAPSARTLLPSAAGPPLDGLVTDAYLSNLVTGPAAAQLGPRLAEQRFLAETAILAVQAPSRDDRTLVIAPDRRTNASVVAASGALRDLGRVPWLCPVTLASVAAQSEHCTEQPRPTPAPADLKRGSLRTDRSGELGASYLKGIAGDRDAISQLTDAVVSASQDPSVRDAVARTKERLRQAVARAESSVWRTNPAGGRTTAALLHSEVARLQGKIVVRGGRALLTSSKGTLQVSIENTLDVPIQVRVRFSSKTATLSSAETGLVEVTPGHAVQAAVKAEAQRSGQFVVFAQIVDRNGRPFGSEAEVIVRSTRFGRLALAVTAGGLGVLLVAAGVRIVRRAVRSRS